MICEILIRVTDRSYNDPARDRQMGDIIALKTLDQIKAKWIELRLKNFVTDNLTEIYTEDSWPWSDSERKGYLITKIDLTYELIKDLSEPFGVVINDEFIQTAFRKKKMRRTFLDDVYPEIDITKIADPTIDYQPLIGSQITDYSCIEDRQ